ncbi:MAG TPA: hypothetical protein VIL00_00945 [Pseudonocardiaceae bacterium]|mgnify:CR=1 FL=1
MRVKWVRSGGDTILVEVETEPDEYDRSNPVVGGRVLDPGGPDVPVDRELRFDNELVEPTSAGWCLLLAGRGYGEPQSHRAPDEQA